MPRDLRFSPPTDKYSIFGLSILSLEMTLDASLSPEGSPVNINITLSYCFQTNSR